MKEEKTAGGAEGFLKVLGSGADALLQKIRANPDYGKPNWNSVLDQKGSVIPYDAAMLICEEILKIVTPEDSNIPYFFEGGIYRPAEKKIYQIVQEGIEEKINTITAREVVFCVRNKTYRSRKDLEAPIDLVCLENGILNLKDMSFGPHDPKYFFFGKIPVVFDLKATCPAINKFLSEVVSPDDAIRLKELAGYCLIRAYPIQDAFMLIGPGGNGKSTYLSLLKAFLGAENVEAIPLQKLQKTFSAANLEGKLGNFCADLSDKSVEELGVFKMLTGGDPINAERKFKDAFNFVNYAKLIFSCNKPPALNDDTQGNWERWEVVEFPNSFRDQISEDQKILDKLVTPEEMSGFLNECLRLLPKLLERRNFTGHIGADKIRRDYIRRSDSLGAFVMEKIKFEPTQFITKREFYEAYCRYCSDVKMAPISDSTVGKQLAGKVYQHLGASISDGQPKLGEKQVKAWLNIWFLDQEPRNNKKQEAITGF